MVGRQAQQSQATRRYLIKRARRLFGRRGYAAVSIAEITDGSGLTRGALYHRFDDKADLFRAVVASVESEVADRIAEAVDEEPRAERRWERGIEVILDAFLDPVVQRILLIDAPAVLGSSTWVAVDARQTTAVLKLGLEVAMKADYVERLPVDALAHFLVGAITEAGMFIAGEKDKRRAREEAGRAVAQITRTLVRAA